MMKMMKSVEVDGRSVIVLVNFITIISHFVVCENCDQFGTLLYEDMGCKPLYDTSPYNREVFGQCPSRYDCLGLKKSNSHCFLKGKPYKLYEMVDSKLTAGMCDLGCYCQRHLEITKFKCATVECPEWQTKDPYPGCYRKYSLDDCCSIREMCSPYDHSTTCTYDGKVYKEGENFFPKNSCWRCVCQSGFRGKPEKPFCRRRTCSVQIKHQEKIQERCAPLYYKQKYRNDDPLCCPQSWICSDGNEKIIGHPRTNKICLFGEKALRVGQKIEKNLQVPRNITVTCECRIPPLLTCLTYVV